MNDIRPSLRSSKPASNAMEKWPRSIGLDLSVAPWRAARPAGAQRCGQEHRDRPAAGADPSPTGQGRAVRTGSAADRRPSPHRRDAARCGNLPPTLRVGELLRLTASYYPTPRPLAESAGHGRASPICSRGPTRSSPAASSAACNSRWRYAVGPELLFLDEPTVGHGSSSRGSDCGQRSAHCWPKGCSVLLTTHYLEEAEALADRVCVMARGRLIHEGTVDALRARVAIRRIRCCSACRRRRRGREWPAVSEARTRAGPPAGGHRRTPKRWCAGCSRPTPRLSELEVQRAGLAEAFAELTREADGQSDPARREAA